ncbi:hypothetical protein [Acinetobacter tianfuensis]|uniref:Uncharacterized protein n=1 Tax=Acinetobacter tianfuensis TaxID=2419603 RepID=A0A3A8E318_9GAMM|nr:hypothetical protein [Acinetobacter tianfuensis]RKG29055.1 hypothetical protein D7V32_16700 [Acinetobacter tianfuensis]
MKDVIPEKTPKNAKIERYTNEIDVKKDSFVTPRFIKFLLRQDAFLWGCAIGAIIAIYRNFDRILSWF